jgi:hypothetical protein
VNLAPADQFDPISYLQVHERVLLRRAKDEDAWSKSPSGPDQPEYYLLDPATGETKLVSGEFLPLRQTGSRSLQPTENANEFWAAIPDRDKNQTKVGRYNLKSFTFNAILDLPKITFDSMSMWVDEKRGKVYVVYQGQLISIPLRPRAD